jgi:excisionase family DNA binding protein
MEAATRPVTLLTFAEAAQRLRVSVRTVEREAIAGRLAIVRIRSRRFIRADELDRYITAREEVQACPSASEATAIRSASALAAALALSAHFRPAPRSPTRGRSKLRSSAPASTLRLVAARDT